MYFTYELGLREIHRPYEAWKSHLSNQTTHKAENKYKESDGSSSNI